MTCFKYRADPEDPVLGTADERLLSGTWSDRRVGRPETSTIGLTFTRGGYSRYGLGVPRASGGYTVARPEHWAFEGTDLRYGDTFGIATRSSPTRSTDARSRCVTASRPHARGRSARRPRGPGHRARPAVVAARAAVPLRARARRAGERRDGAVRRHAARERRRDREQPRRDGDVHAPAAARSSTPA